LRFREFQTSFDFGLDDVRSETPRRMTSPSLRLRKALAVYPDAEPQ
jgi:hypothetical protein